MARRLAENVDVSVLLLEAGGPDGVPTVMRAEQWPLILGSEQDWNFAAQPHLNGRKFAHCPPLVADRSARFDLSPAYSNRTSLKSIATISISIIGRRSGPRV